VTGQLDEEEEYDADSLHTERALSKSTNYTTPRVPYYRKDGNNGTDRGPTMNEDDLPDAPDLPAAQYIAPEVVLMEMGEAGAKRAMSLTAVQVLILSTMAGAFITAGALFSTLIATGTDNEGIKRLLEGFGFSVGFFLVILSGALLFTEANVELPATLLNRNR
jgi:hypothetical protein